MARTGSLASLRAGVRTTVGEIGATAHREALRTENHARAERANWATLPHDRILPDPDQPRKFFDADKLRALADNIRTLGLREPVRVYPAGFGGKYRLLDGQRRWHAVDMLLEQGLEQHREMVVLFDEVPPTKAGLRVEQLVTSLHKESFVPLETAAVLLQIAEAGGEVEPLSAARLAERFGFHPKHTERHLKVARALTDDERTYLLSAYPDAPLDPLEKLASWLNSAAAAALDAAGRQQAIERFGEAKPAARAVAALLRPLGSRKPPGRPARLQFRAGPTPGGGWAVHLRIPPTRAADPDALEQAEQELETALTELRRLRSERRGHRD